MTKKKDDTLAPKAAAQRRDAVLSTMLKTPPKPHKSEAKRGGVVARGKPKRDA